MHTPGSRQGFSRGEEDPGTSQAWRPIVWKTVEDWSAPGVKWMAELGTYINYQQRCLIGTYSGGRREEGGGGLEGDEGRQVLV